MIIINKSHIIFIKSGSHSNSYYISIFTASEIINRNYKTKEECELILREIRKQLSTRGKFVEIND